MDCSLPGFSVCGISQARVLEWVAISLSRDLPDPGIKPGSPALQADSLPAEPPRTSLQALKLCRQFWRLDIQHEGVARATLPPQALGRILLCFLEVLWLRVTPWLVAASTFTIVFSSAILSSPVCLLQGCLLGLAFTWIIHDDITSRTLVTTSWTFFFQTKSYSQM